ncbi:hypothetical protein RFI_01388, partial [Reticulomyxa filosa]
TTTRRSRLRDSASAGRPVKLEQRKKKKPSSRNSHSPATTRCVGGTALGVNSPVVGSSFSPSPFVLPSSSSSFPASASASTSASLKKNKKSHAKLRSHFRHVNAYPPLLQLHRHAQSDGKITVATTRTHHADIYTQSLQQQQQQQQQQQNGEMEARSEKKRKRKQDYENETQARDSEHEYENGYDGGAYAFSPLCSSQRSPHKDVYVPQTSMSFSHSPRSELHSSPTPVRSCAPANARLPVTSSNDSNGHADLAFELEGDAEIEIELEMEMEENEDEEETMPCVRPKFQSSQSLDTCKRAKSSAGRLTSLLAQRQSRSRDMDSSRDNSPRTNHLSRASRPSSPWRSDNHNTSQSLCSNTTPRDQWDIQSDTNGIDPTRLQQSSTSTTPPDHNYAHNHMPSPFHSSLLSIPTSPHLASHSSNHTRSKVIPIPTPNKQRYDIDFKPSIQQVCNFSSFHTFFFFFEPDWLTNGWEHFCVCEI